MNSKWEREETEQYLLFLSALKNYIHEYVFTFQVGTLNDFEEAMFVYGEKENPVGFQLYQHQVDYIIKKAKGIKCKP